MLIEFSVANYRSFRDEVTLSMVASPLKAEGGELDERNLFAAPGDINLLPSAAIYGANASGKSNLIAAIDFMQTFVRYSLVNTEGFGRIEVEPFRLNTQTDDQPSSFEAVFIVDGRRYRYGFEVTVQRVVAEWLFVASKVRESRLFERNGDKIVLGAKFKAEGRRLAARTRPNALFLSVVAQFNGKIAQQVLGWFGSLGMSSSPDDMAVGMRLFTEMLLNDEDSGHKIVDLIKQSDLGVEDIRMEKIALPTPGLILPTDDAPEEIHKLHSALKTFHEFLDDVDEFNQEEQMIVRTVHRKVDDTGQPVAPELFDLDGHESEGTRKLFAMSGPLVESLKNGDVLIVDELDVHLHPLLTREIVRLFNDPETNPNHAQLIFATHDTNLLDSQLLRRDQIWFAEKDRQGASHLISLVEFNIPHDASLDKDYIQGRYGAIPFLGDITQVLLDKS